MHVGWSVSAKGLRGGSVALAAALDLVQDHTGCDDEEDAAKGAAESHDDYNAIGVASRYLMSDTSSRGYIGDGRYSRFLS